MLSVSEDWFSITRPVPDAALRLFCFSGMGSSAAFFSAWPAFLPRSIELCAVRSPGRMVPFDDLAALPVSHVVEAIAQAIGESQDRPCAFFAHSMGALLAFEVARSLQVSGRIMPCFLAFACCPPPGLFLDVYPHFKLSRKDAFEAFFLQKTPFPVHPSMMEEKETMALLLQMDFLLWQNYQYLSAEKLDCPLTVFGGWQDQFLPPRTFYAWKDYTSRRFSLQMFPGDHFFFYRQPEPLLEAMIKELSNNQVAI